MAKGTAGPSVTWNPGGVGRDRGLCQGVSVIPLLTLWNQNTMSPPDCITCRQGIADETGS